MMKANGGKMIRQLLETIGGPHSKNRRVAKPQDQSGLQANDFRLSHTMAKETHFCQISIVQRSALSWIVTVRACPLTVVRHA